MQLEQRPSQDDEGRKPRVEVYNVDAEGNSVTDEPESQGEENAEPSKDEEGEDEETISVESPKGKSKDADAKDDSEGDEGEPKEEALTVTLDDGSAEGEDDEPKGGKDSETIKHFRKRFEKQRRQIHELREKLQAAGIQEQPKLPEPPTLEQCDYDEDEFRRRTAKWTEQKLQIAQQEEAIKREQQKQAIVWQRKVEQYKERKRSFGAKDYSEAEELVRSELGDVKYMQILEGAKKPEDVIYALAKHPDVLEELAKLDSNNSFAWRASELQGRIVKVQPRKPSAPPEKIPRSTVAATGMTENTLEALRKKAHETGEFSKYHAEKRRQARLAAER